MKNCTNMIIYLYELRERGGYVEQRETTELAREESWGMGLGERAMALASALDLDLDLLRFKSESDFNFILNTPGAGGTSSFFFSTTNFFTSSSISLSFSLILFFSLSIQSIPPPKPNAFFYLLSVTWKMGHSFLSLRETDGAGPGSPEDSAHPRLNFK